MILLELFFIMCAIKSVFSQCSYSYYPGLQYACNHQHQIRSVVENFHPIQGIQQPNIQGVNLLPAYDHLQNPIKNTFGSFGLHTVPAVNQIKHFGFQNLHSQNTGKIFGDRNIWNFFRQPQNPLQQATDETNAFPGHLLHLFYSNNPNGINNKNINNQTPSQFQPHGSLPVQNQGNPISEIHRQPSQPQTLPSHNMNSATVPNTSNLSENNNNESPDYDIDIRADN